MKPRALSIAPFKALFVTGLTRDIDLEAAILDLMDNSVDAAFRDSPFGPDDENRYSGYAITLNIDKNGLVLRDNCGGFDKKRVEYALRIGRPRSVSFDDTGTVGMYGIGMKRAWFKLGRAIHLESINKTQDYRFSMDIDETWLSNDELDGWDVDVYEDEDSGIRLMDASSSGTAIKVEGLWPGVEDSIRETAFLPDLKNQIARVYNVAIAHGLRIFLNGERISPLKHTWVISDPESDGMIEPYYFEGMINGIKTQITVGFANLSGLKSSADENNDASEGERLSRSSGESGISIICNDRVVLLNDKSERTGWGVSGVPRFHNQYVGLVGRVNFWSDDPNRLPLTTTKRGLDYASSAYIHVASLLRDAIKIFTDLTNRMKTADSNTKNELIQSASAEEAEMVTNSLREKASARGLKRPQKKHFQDPRQYFPKLPKLSSSTMTTVRFLVDSDEYDDVRRREFPETAGVKPGEVGRAVWDYYLKSVGHD